MLEYHRSLATDIPLNTTRQEAVDNSTRGVKPPLASLHGFEKPCHPANDFLTKHSQ